MNTQLGSTVPLERIDSVTSDMLGASAMKTHLLLGAAALGLVLSACPPSEKSEKAEPSTEKREAQPSSMPADTKTATTSAAPSAAQPALASAEDGKKLYMTACVTCHGPDGTGQAMRQLLPKIGDLTSPEMHTRMKDEDLAALITTGRDKMPPFGAVFKPEQINAIISFVRTMKKG